VVELLRRFRRPILRSARLSACCPGSRNLPRLPHTDKMIESPGRESPGCTPLLALLRLADPAKCPVCAKTGRADVGSDPSCRVQQSDSNQKARVAGGRANAFWGAPRIHGELLKPGFEVAQSTVAQYMCRHPRPPSQGWRTFLSNHVDGIAAIDLFVLPTIAFQILYCLVIVRHGRRLWVSLGVTANPTADWISRQVTEAAEGQ